MTPAEAITRMRTELNELERKQLLRPSHLQAKRQWVDTLENALNQHKHELIAVHKRLHELQEQLEEAQLRTGMLANVLTILGFSPWLHLKAPLNGSTYSNPDVYELAAQQQDERDRQQGLTNRLHMIKYRRHLDGLLRNALWHARLTLMLQPFQHLIQQHQPHGQEDRTAA